MKLNFKRGGAVTGAVGVIAGALLVAGSVLNSAAASTIPTGELQICAQGNYSAFVQPIMTATIPGGQHLANEVVPPGQCFLLPLNTYGQWVRVDVIGERPDGSQFSLGSQWYDSSVSGLGIGAEGSWSAGPFVWTW